MRPAGLQGADEGRQRDRLRRAAPSDRAAATRHARRADRGCTASRPDGSALGQVMRRGDIILDRDFTIGETDPRLFGAFVEHLGRCVYGGIFEPGHPDRRREGLSPGRDGAGARTRRRPSCAIPAAISSPATTGKTASARSSSGRAGSTTPGCPPRPTASAPTNSSTGAGRPASSRCWRSISARAARRKPARFIEYCNHPGGTALSDLRRAHGWEQPHGVKFWCLGNEMDGPGRSAPRPPTNTAASPRRPPR